MAFKPYENHSKKSSKKIYNNKKPFHNKNESKRKKHHRKKQNNIFEIQKEKPNDHFIIQNNTFAALSKLYKIKRGNRINDTIAYQKPPKAIYQVGDKHISICQQFFKQKNH